MARLALKTISLVGALALAFGVTSVLAETETPAPQKEVEILGIVTPAQTTLAEAEAALTQKGCEYKEETFLNKGRRITVSPGCFQLVGDPRVLFVGPAVDMPIGNAWLEFDAGLGADTYNRYLDALKKTYGDPTTTGFEGGERYALWNAEGKKLVVILVGGEATGPHLINYYFGDNAEQLWTEFQKRHATTDKDMSTL